MIAFDGVQGGAPIPDCSLLLPFEPDQDPGGADATTRAIALVVAAWRGGAHDREALLSALRTAGPFGRRARRPRRAARLALPRGCGLSAAGPSVVRHGGAVRAVVATSVPPPS